MMMTTRGLLFTMLVLSVSAWGGPPKKSKPAGGVTKTEKEAIVEAVATPPNAVECQRSGLKSSVSSTWTFECKPVYRPKFDGIEWQERISIIGANSGPCAEPLNQCERATMEHERAPGCGGVWPPPEECFLNQLRARAPMLKNCYSAAVCQVEAHEAMMALRAAERQQKLGELQKAPKRAPTCSYDGRPGDWTCQAKGCGEVQLPGVEVGTRDTNPCRWANALDTELMLELGRERCGSKDKACDQRKKCIDTMRTALSEEAKDCAVLHPTPPGVQRSTVCRSARWGRSPYDGMFGEADACRLLDPPVYAEETAADAGAGPEDEEAPAVLDETRLDGANAQCVLAQSDASQVRRKFFSRCGQYCEGKSGAALCRAAGLSREVEAECVTAWPKAERALGDACREWEEQRVVFEEAIRDASRRASGRPLTFAIDGERESYPTQAACEDARKQLAVKRGEQARVDALRKCDGLVAGVESYKRQQGECRQRHPDTFFGPSPRCASWADRIKEQEAAAEKCKTSSSTAPPAPVEPCRKQ